MKKFNLSKSGDIQPETLLKNKLFHRNYFASFLSGILFTGYSCNKQPNQPSAIIEPGKHLKPVTLARPFSFTTLPLWKLKARCGMKWL